MQIHTFTAEEKKDKALTGGFGLGVEVSQHAKQPKHLCDKAIYDHCLSLHQIKFKSCGPLYYSTCQYWEFHTFQFVLFFMRNLRMNMFDSEQCVLAVHRTNQTSFFKYSQIIMLYFRGHHQNIPLVSLMFSSCKGAIGCFLVT